MKPHSVFKRTDDDVSCEVRIGFPQAALGGEIVVPTLEGPVKMRIPPGTPSGKVFRLKGKGITRQGGSGRGDQQVTVAVYVPPKLTPRQKELLVAFEEAGEEEAGERKAWKENLFR